MKITNFGDLLKHLNYTAERPSAIQCLEFSRLIEQLRSAWNFGHAAGVKETQDEYHEKALQAIRETARVVAQGHVADAGIRVDSGTKDG
jgi:hypothetical protein